LFWAGGSTDMASTITNYTLEPADSFGNGKYTFFRTAFDVSNIGKFSINLKTSFCIDGNPNFIDTVLQIEKKKKLTWNRFSVQ